MQKEQQMQTKPSQPTETVSRPTGIKMALLLFWEFIKLGAFTFGSGWSIIAQMEQEFVDKRHWVEQSDLLELIAVGKSLPGIMVANIVLLFALIPDFRDAMPRIRWRQLRTILAYSFPLLVSGRRDDRCYRHL